MHTVIVSTNSWCTIAYADSYFDGQYNRSAWASLSLNDRSRLLIHSFTWINQQTDFVIAPTDSSVKVKQAQCEAAWFIRGYFEYYEKNRAMIESGLTSHRDMDFSENFQKEIKFPPFIAQMLSPYATGSGGVFPEITRENEENI